MLKTVIAYGEVWGLGMPISVLLGSHDKGVQRIRNYSDIETFGDGKGHSEPWWKALAHQLTETECLLDTTLVQSAGKAFSYYKYGVSSKGKEFLRSVTQPGGVYSYTLRPSQDLQRCMQAAPPIRRMNTIPTTNAPRDAVYVPSYLRGNSKGDGIDGSSSNSSSSGSSITASTESQFSSSSSTQLKSQVRMYFTFGVVCVCYLFCISHN